jgi:4-hydroxy-3-polyprenylbenzoate decarboxylase
MHSLDLRDWIHTAKTLGELRELVGADRDVDIGPLTQTAESLPNGGPALLFDQIVGFPKGFRILTNANNSIGRFACTSFIKDCFSVKDAIHSWRKLTGKLTAMPPVEIQEGPITENIIEAPDIDLDLFPTPKWHSHDGGRYIGTGDVVITSDPETGRVNLGTYRMMIVNQNTLAGWIAQGKHAAQHRQRYFERGKPCPVVVSCGHHPLFLLAGASGIREDLTELEIVGSIVGHGVEVIRGRHTGLPIPAQAEIAIEGEFSPTETVMEGPFGEWTGYYASPSRAEPIIKVKAIYFRNDPILLGSPPSKPSPSNIQNRIQRSIAIEDHLKSCGLPGIKGVWLHQPGGTRYLLAISIKQNYPGHAKQVAMAALGGKNSNYVGRFIIVVDDDIDVTDLNDVLWAASTRSDPKEAISIIDGFWTSPLDPAIPWEVKKTSSRAVIDACWPYERLPNVPKSCNITPEHKEHMQKKWKLSDPQ